jgi:hypothetical protein
MVRKLCFCRERQVDLERATYTVDATPCCGRECYEEALEAHGNNIDYTLFGHHNSRRAAAVTAP